MRSARRRRKRRRKRVMERRESQTQGALRVDRDIVIEGPRLLLEGRQVRWLLRWGAVLHTGAGDLKAGWLKTQLKLQ